ncbi:Zn-ribbon domain-containing OB-fold protein [Streptomyces geranii]|uniref:Zn-ribbon domain-containing OB-fold protein n=1 Tax=Streptomyces geranii TaxID=2058923 RepID=UPI000D03ACF8|nr:zinc ribbon domain-containing protein [Streptomyces geranii]
MLRTDTLEDTSEHISEYAGEHTESGEGRELLFQRCRWCGTPAYRRSYCRSCGSTAFVRQRSEGTGVVVRRNGHAPHNTWFVAMDEGFHLLCQVTGTAPVVVAVGARVSVVRTVAPLGQGLPLVEVARPASPLGRRW